MPHAGPIGTQDVGVWGGIPEAVHRKQQARDLLLALGELMVIRGELALTLYAPVVAFGCNIDADAGWNSRVTHRASTVGTSRSSQRLRSLR